MTYTEVYRKAVSSRRKTLLINSINFSHKIRQILPLLEQSIHIIKSIFMFKNTKSSHPSMSALCNCDPGITSFLRKCITSALGKKKKKSWMASKAKKQGAFWGTYLSACCQLMCLLWCVAKQLLSVSLLHLLLLSCIVSGVDTHIHSLTSRR